MTPATSPARRLILAVVALALAVVGLVTGDPATAAPSAPAGPRPAAAAAAATTAKPLGYTPVGPVRLLDTRTNPTIHTRGPASVATLKVTGVGGVPASGVGAVALNVTAIATTHSTFITVYPAGAARPTASNLNVALKRTRANEVIAQVGAGGAISFYNASGLTDVLVDISGWFATGSSYTGRSPARLLDTRNGGSKPRAAATSTVLKVTGVASVPSTGVSAVVLNLTGISMGGGTFVTAYPTGSTRPTTSNLNLAAAQTAAIMVVATPSASGQITLYNSGGPTHLVVDVAGWFTGTNDYHPLVPTRLLDSRITGGFTAGSTPWPVQISGRGNVPTTATAAIVTVTVVQPAAGGHVTVFPFGSKDPGTSTVNVRANETTANLAIVSLSDDGRIAVLVRDKAQRGILVDIVGWLDATPALHGPDPTASVSPVAQVGQPYSWQLSASGGYPPYTWTAPAGALPAGLTLSATGLVSGTPTAAGFSSAITVTDGAGQSVVVDPLGQPLVRAVLFTSRDVWAWGSDTNNHLTVNPVSLPALAGARQVAVNRSSCDTTYVLRGDQTVWGWGDGTNGALGNNAETYAPPDVPVQVSNLTGVVGIAGQSCGGYALKSDGTVWAWGFNNNSKNTLGTDTPSATDVPLQVPGLDHVVTIGSGGYNGYAIKDDGTLWAWGNNDVGQLGIGTGVPTTGPVQVLGLTNVTSVVGGASTTYALDGAGHVWAWGDNANGEVGTGTASATPVPNATQVPITGTVTSIGAGAQTGYAVTSTGKVWAWGRGDDGELGDGGTSDSATPVAVSGLTSVTSVAGAKSTALALRSDGTVWSWGAESFRLLGRDPGTSSTSTPALVSVPQATQLITHGDGAEAYIIGVP